MSNKQIKKEQTGDRQTIAIQTNIAAATQQLRDGPFGNGTLVKGIVFDEDVSQKINHGLGRAYQGFVVVRCQASYTLTKTPAPLELLPQPSDVDPTKQISMYSITFCTADIWFY